MEKNLDQKTQSNGFKEYLKQLKSPMFILIAIILGLAAIIYYQYTSSIKKIESLRIENKQLLDSNIQSRAYIKDLTNNVNRYKNMYDELKNTINKRDTIIKKLEDKHNNVPKEFKLYNDSMLLNYYQNYFKNHE